VLVTDAVLAVVVVDDDGGGNDVDSDDDFYRTIQSYSTNILTKLITQLFRRN
jgi:hypothetical protein